MRTATSTIGLWSLGLVLVTLSTTQAADRPSGAPPDPRRNYSEKEAIQIGWPSLAGPYGSFVPLKTDVPIVDDLSKVTIAWESEISDLGIGKQGTPFGKSFQSGDTVKKYLGPEAGRHPGNWAGVIVAEGKVFAASFRPTGPLFECDFPDGKAAKIRLDADDFVVAMDFDTGKTLWLSAEPGGMLVGGGKRQGFQVAPVYSRGRVFAMGSTGRLFAYDAATGKKLWQGDIGPSHKKQTQQRAQILEGLARRRFSYAQNPHWHASLTVAENTLVVPTFDRGGLRGVEVEAGKTLWEAAAVGSHLTTPSIWPCAGREYILTATTTGQLRLLDPRAHQLLLHARRARAGEAEPGIFLESAPICRDYTKSLADRDAPTHRPAGEHPDPATNGGYLDILEANLKVFGAENAQVLEYWLDVS